MGSYYADCIECEELSGIAREVQELYKERDHYRELYFETCRDFDKLEAELKQLRKKEVTP